MEAPPHIPKRPESSISNNNVLMFWLIHVRKENLNDEYF